MDEKDKYIKELRAKVKEQALEIERLEALSNDKIIKAKWITFDGQFYHCSRCGREIYNIKANFCPECGSKMAEQVEWKEYERI